jgi:hypothetical protein
MNNKPWLLDYFDWLFQLKNVFDIFRSIMAGIFTKYITHMSVTLLSCITRISNSCVRIRYCAILRNMINELSKTRTKNETGRNDEN